MKRQKEFFFLSNKKSLFEESDEEKLLDTFPTPPLDKNDASDSDRDELKEFLQKNLQGSRRKPSFETKTNIINNLSDAPSKKINSNKDNAFIVDDDDDSEDIIFLDNSIDERLFSNDSGMNVDLPHFCNKKNIYHKTKAPKRKPRKTQIEKNLEKLAELPIINTDFNHKIDFNEFAEPAKIDIMVMVFFKGITKKYLVQSLEPLIESLTPKIKENYPEIADTPLHFFKFYDEDNKPLDFTKTPESLQLKYADSIVFARVDCIIVPSEGDEEDFRTDMISVKFQDGSKHPIVLKVKPSDSLEPLFNKYLNKTNKTWDKVKFYFDGDLLAKHQSPCDLDMDDDFCIDVVFV